ncbi:MAG: response regulator transcription factor [Steroidobacteraceae bacterium]
MVAPLNILLVEDHDALREVTREVLARQGHRVMALSRAESLSELPAEWRTELAVLDLNLPGEDGLSLAQRLRREQPGVGIVMLTVRGQLEERLAGYEHGADIYLAKPTDPQELCATVAALGRRLHRADPGGRAEAAFRLDCTRQILGTPQGPLSLRPAEFNVLEGLASAPDQRLGHSQLLERLGKPDDPQGKAQLEVIISRLRSRLETRGAPARSIIAERGQGYRLCLKIEIA